MSRNEQEMKRLVTVVGEFLHAGRDAANLFLHRELVARTRKRTQFAAGWQVGVGGPPPITPGKPQVDFYPLPDENVVRAELATASMDDEIVHASPADYIRRLEELDEFIEPAIAEAQRQLAQWRHKA